MANDFKHAKEFSIAGGRLFVAPMRVKDVVAIEGSVLGGANMLPKDQEVVAGLAIELLDAGTNTKKKEAIRESLAARGISLSFASGGDRTYFSAQCFPEDLQFALSLVRECLGNAAFPEPEVKNAKARALGDLEEEKSETRSQVERALARLLYDPSHVNYAHTIGEEELEVKRARRADLASFRSKLGRGGLVLAITGDVSETDARRAAENAFEKLGEGTNAVSIKTPNEKRATAEEKIIPIADKANIDVLFGASLPIVKKDPRYHPIAVVTDMLGGGFAGHLMQTVRERDGLTYGVYATLSGFADGADGYFKVWATFSPGLYERSVEALKKEIRSFFEHGLTEDALAKKKDEIAGSYVVGLSTTRGMARMLHQIGADDRPLSYLSEYPGIIRAISLPGAESVAGLIPLDKLSFAASGTFPKR